MDKDIVFIILLHILHRNFAMFVSVSNKTLEENLYGVKSLIKAVEHKWMQSQPLTQLKCKLQFAYVLRVDNANSKGKGASWCMNTNYCLVFVVKTIFKPFMFQSCTISTNRTSAALIIQHFSSSESVNRKYASWVYLEIMGLNWHINFLSKK